jgi:glycosyltransferase involved in cell wall biosynthesis
MSPVPLPTLSIFFPMYNEEENIRPAINTAREECELLLANAQIRDYELIVVDDASSDATGKIADELSEADPRVRVVHHPRNRKLGGAIKTGFASATGDLVLYSDADLPFDMAEVAKALRIQRLYDADIVSAYRMDRTGEGYLRALYTWLYNNMLHVLFGVRIRDVNFSFKLCRRAMFEHVVLKSEGSFIDAELIIRASRMGFRITQFGADYFPRIRGTSTLASPAVIMKIVKDMLTLRRELQAIRPLAR